MRSGSLICILALMLGTLASGPSAAQTIHMLSNASGFDLDVDAIVFNNKLYSKVHSGNGRQLGVFDGTTQRLIPNPANPYAGDQSCAYEGDPFIFKDKLYLRCRSPLGPNSYQLGIFDGNKTTLVYNLLTQVNDFSTLFAKPFAAYGDQLYLLYRYQSPTVEGPVIVRVDDNALKAIPNPPGFFPEAFLTVYQKQLYLSFGQERGSYQLGRFDGNQSVVFPNPDGGSGSWGHATIYKEKMLLTYWNKAKINQLAQYDGTSVTLIPNPDAGKGCSGTPFLYGEKLYLSYANDKGVSQLAAYDGSVVTLIPNPPNGMFLAEKNDFIVCNNRLYLRYTKKVPLHVGVGFDLLDQWAAYDGSTLMLIPNPPGIKTAAIQKAVVYNNKLYVKVEKSVAAASVGYLAQIDGTKISLVPNLQEPGIPVVFDNKLYISYGDNEGARHIGYIDSHSDGAGPAAASRSAALGSAGSTANAPAPAANTAMSNSLTDAMNKATAGYKKGYTEVQDAVITPAGSPDAYTLKYTDPNTKQAVTVSLIRAHRFPGLPPANEKVIVSALDAQGHQGDYVVVADGAADSGVPGSFMGSTTYIKVQVLKDNVVWVYSPQEVKSAQKGWLPSPTKP